MRKLATKLSYFSENAKYFFLIFALLALIPASGQVFFEHTFGSPLDDRARALQQLADGSIYIAGFSNAGPNGGYDVAVSKISPGGIEQWTKYYGKQADEYTLYMNKTSDNALILCGESQGTVNGVDAWIMKIDSSGNVIFLKGVSTMVNESFKYIEETNDGGFIMAGFQSDSSNSNDIYVVKTDSAGDMVWQKNYGGPDNDYADAIKQTSDGGYIISADTKSFGAQDYDIYMLKIDSVGNFEWDNLSGDVYADGCQGFIITSDNGYFTFGESIVSLSLPYQFFFQLTDSLGVVKWEKYMGGAGTDAGFSAIETADGGFIVTGYSNSNYINQPIDLVLIKLNNQGDSVWSQYYGGTGIDIGYQIIDCIGGGHLVAGTTWQNNNDFYLLKVNDLGVVSTGTIQHNAAMLQVYPNPGNGNFVVSADKSLTDPVIKLYDIMGKIVCEKTYKGSFNYFKINASPENGIYFLIIEAEQGIYESKVIINH